MCRKGLNLNLEFQIRSLYRSRVLGVQDSFTPKACKLLPHFTKRLIQIFIYIIDVKCLVPYFDFLLKSSLFPFKAICGGLLE